MRNRILTRLKVWNALQVLLVATFFMCVGALTSWAAETNSAVDTLRPSQKIVCNQEIQLATKSLPSECTTIGITTSILSPYQGGIETLGYESSFCQSPKAKLKVDSAQALLTKICQEANNKPCQTQLKGIDAAQKPLASFSCGVTKLYLSKENRTDWYNNILGQRGKGEAPDIFANKFNTAVTSAKANQTSAGQQGATLAKLQADFSQICFACGLVSRLYTTSIVYGEKVTAALGREIVKLMGIGLALYMAFIALKLFFPFGPQDKMVGLVNKLSISVLITVALSFLYLTDTSYKFYWNYVYNPIIDAAINMNDQLLTEGSGEGTFFGRLNAQNIVCSTPDMSGADLLTAEQNASRNKLQCQVHKLQYVFTYGFATGVYILLQGSYISGGILIAIYVFAPLVFAFAIVDALMRWTFMSVLSPALMACGCFPLTRKYAYLGVRVMLEAAISFVVVAVIAVLISGMMEQSLSALNDKLGEKNLPKWLENSLTTGQLENSAAVVAAADFNEFYQADGEQDYVTTLLSGMLNRETVNFPPQYPQRTTLTPSGMQDVYEDRALATATSVTKGASEGFKCRVLPSPAPINSPFGWRWGRMHNGVDMAADRGTPISSVDAGTVLRTNANCGESSGRGDPCGGGYGNYIEILHAGGWVTNYNHLNPGSVNLKTGDKVSAGQAIAQMGNTGSSTGSHLHFEVLANGTTPTDPAICFNGAAMPNGVFTGTTANGNPAAALFSAPAFDYSDSDFMIFCAAGLLAGFLGKNFGNIGAQFLGGQTFGVSSGGALSNMAAAGAQWAGALGGVGMGFARNALTPTTANPSGNNTTGNPIPDLMRKADDYLMENSEAYNRAKEFVDNTKNAIENNPVVKGVTDKVDALKAGLESFSQTRGGKVADAVLSGATAVVTTTVSIGVSLAGSAASSAAHATLSMTSNLLIDQATRALEATGYAELAGAVGGGFAQGVGTGMSWVPEKRTVFINRDVVKQYVAMQGSIRDAQDRVEQKAIELAAMDDVNSKGYIQNDAERKIAKDRLALELYRATAELKLLELAAKYDVTGRYNIQLQKEIGYSRGEVDEALKGKIDSVAEQERRLRSFEKTLKQDAENVRYTPEIEKAIIAASMKGFANKQSPTVAGYTQINTESVDDTLRGTSADVAGLATKESAKTTTQTTSTERQAAFAALGLKEGATEEEIQKARKALLKDMASNVDAAEKSGRLLEVNQAYDLLSQARQEKLEANKGYRDAAGNSLNQPVTGQARTGTLALAAAKEPELKGLQKVAGYKEKEPEYKTKESSGTETQSSIERGMFINTSDSNSNADKTRDEERIAASTDDEKKSSSREARNNIVAAKDLPKKKSAEWRKPKPANNIARFVRKKTPLNSLSKNSPAAQKEREAANSIERFVRRKQEQDLVAAGRNPNNDDDDRGGAS